MHVGHHRGGDGTINRRASTISSKCLMGMRGCPCSNIKCFIMTKHEPINTLFMVNTNAKGYVRTWGAVHTHAGVEGRTSCRGCVEESTTPTTCMHSTDDTGGADETTYRLGNPCTTQQCHDGLCSMLAVHVGLLDHVHMREQHIQQDDCCCCCHATSLCVACWSCMHDNNIPNHLHSTQPPAHQKPNTQHTTNTQNTPNTHVHWRGPRRQTS